MHRRLPLEIFAAAVFTPSRLLSTFSLVSIQDEPEAGVGFSHKMNLKGMFRMLGIDHQHGRLGEVEPGADPGVFGGQRGSAVPSAGARRTVRLVGWHASPARLTYAYRVRPRGWCGAT